ncbi:hypothetical protein WMY93_001824 [Mugilogobius chulae]|uniref:Deoxyribonuclease-2-alpha n=1 Tax=Mugilogobius chulae TaxID=88201 RepID=A0AAW0PS07_9GOBI
MTGLGARSPRSERTQAPCTYGRSHKERLQKQASPAHESRQCPGPCAQFIVYKPPGSATLNKFVYIDSSKMKVYDGQVKDFLGNTLSPMLKSVRDMKASFGFLSYNDQPPGCNSADKYGHSKGLVMGDRLSKEALWMVHSTPQFPFMRDQNHFWPESGNVKGQTFMCVSLNYDDLETVGKHLQNIRALVFDQDLPEDFPKGLRDAVQKRTEETRDDSLQGQFKTLRTRGGEDLPILAKRNDPKKNPSDGDLYVQLANAFQSDMAAQTYGCQRDKDTSFCTGKFKVLNVLEIHTGVGDWKRTQDHSKWAVTTDKDWTCISDSNRSPSQYERPGGALCINNKNVNNVFREFIKEIEKCGGPIPPPSPCDDSDLEL